MIVPQRFARLAKRIEEVAALLDCGPLRLMALVLGDEDVEAVKTRVLAAHLAAHPQAAGRPIEWGTIQVKFVQPPEIAAPGDSEIHYTAVDGLLTLTNAEGAPIEIGGRRFSRRRCRATRAGLESGTRRLIMGRHLPFGNISVICCHMAEGGQRGAAYPDQH
jgi:hypothetical protein